MSTAAEWMAELATERETAELLGEWWMIYRDGYPVRMVWAGGREMYDEACALAESRWGVRPIMVPLSAFVATRPVEEAGTP